MRWAVATVGIVLALAGCGSSNKTKWQDHMTSWFSDTSVTPPEPEQQRWERKDWEIFLQRIGNADVAAVGSLKVMNIFSVFKMPKQVLLSFQPSELLWGSLDGLSAADRSLELTITEGDEDFEVAIRAQQHVAGTKFLLFAKVQPQRRKWGPPRGWRGSLWRAGPKERKPFRWVLYRPEAALLARVRTMYRWLKHKD